MGEGATLSGKKADEEAYSDYFLNYKELMEEVVIVEQPQSGHVVKSRPYLLGCKALNAQKIRFKCNNRWLDDSRVETVLGTDAASQLPYMESSVEITRQEVDTGAHLEDFTCQCYASGTSEAHTIRSDPARVRIAYMRKHFVQTPSSDRVSEGTTVQLPCVAPDADPKATITWSRDGDELARTADSNVIYANDGSLIISAARLIDSGNYSCEATNLAAKRSTDPIQLNVFVNGGWSAWSPWTGSCQTDCQLLRLQLAASNGSDVLPRLRRTRLCNNPPPLNGGAYCPGPEEDFRPCDVPCKIDGRWAPWSDWSPCNPTCSRFRSRSCTSPPPLNGGLNCSGKDLESDTCSQGYCLPMQPSLSSDAALLTGVACVAVLLLVIIGLCSALLCRQGKKKSSSANIYYAESGGHVRRVLLNQKIVEDEKQLGSQFFTLASTCSPSPLHPSMTLRSARSAYSGYSANRNVGSRAALITECSSNSSSGGGKIALLRTSSNCSDDDNNYATLYDFMEEKSAGGLETSQAVLAAEVDSTGARLQLRRSGASLLVPENAVDEERMIYLAVSDQLNDLPTLPPGEFVLSSVVIVGECEAEKISDRPLLKPLVVSFRHCASVFPRDNWTFMLYTDEGYGWHPAVTMGEENLNTTVHVHMEVPGRRKDGIGWCHVITDSFSRTCLVGRARRPSIQPFKTVHLAAYGPAERPRGKSFEIRIYCVPETGAAMESVNRQEDRGRLLAETEQFILSEKGELCFCVENLSSGFSLKGNALVEISEAQHRWCSQNGLHCSIPIAIVDNVPVEEFNARLVIYQKTNPGETHKMLIRFENSVYDKSPVEEDKVVTVDFHLSAELKEALGELLDPPSDNDQDWRALARKLHFDRYLQYFGTRPGRSPTVTLLDLWEACEYGSLRAVHDLLQTLRVMGRPDCMLLLEDHLSHFAYSVPS